MTKLIFSVLFVLTALLPRFITTEERERLIVWNVGQGQWLTWVEQSRCLHFDMGGETMDWRRLKKICGGKLNQVYFSHWDQDHISLIKKARQNLRHFCVAKMPGGSTKSSRKLKLFENVLECKLQDSATQQLVTTNDKKTSNDSSRVFLLNESILIPGDSSRAQEISWAQQINSRVKLLVLGHHGSRTSTSEAVISKLSAHAFAVASARRSRYGHPHKEVRQKLKEHGIAVLSTNDWGSIETYR